MFLIFGIQPMIKRIGVTAHDRTCSVCGRSGPWVLVQVRTWVTLFFLRVFPVNSKRVLRCPHCGAELRVDKSNEGELLADILLEVEQ